MKFLRRSKPTKTLNSLTSAELVDKVQENCVLLIGSARSGTTWVAEALNADRHFHVLFEPFKRNKVRHWPYKFIHYLRPEDSFEHQDLFSQIMLGRFANNWINQVKINNLSSEKKFVKEIRLSFMSGWIRTNYPELKILILLRDPYATTFSAVKRGWSVNIDKIVLSQSKLIKDYPEAKDLAMRAKSLFERNFLKWCIENRIVLDNLDLKNPNTKVIYYEDLVSDPVRFYQDLESFFGKEGISERKISKAANRRSSTDSDKQKSSIDSQMKGLSKSELEYAKTCLKKLRLTNLYKGHQPIK